MISVIIPIFNEEKILRGNSKKLISLSRHAELIFVDGGSSDKSIEIAAQHGKVFKEEKGRARQMNFGARHAQSDILFFLHTDNNINSDTILAIENQVSKNGIIGGCLTQRIDKEGMIYRIIETQGNVRARISKVFYGDQGIFVKKDIFFQLGGFPDVPIMEDVLFTKRLRRIGKTTVLSDRIFVSPRRWEKIGIIKTILRYNTINTMFKSGVSLDKIKGFYEDIR